MMDSSKDLLGDNTSESCDTTMKQLECGKSKEKEPENIVKNEKLSDENNVVAMDCDSSANNNGNVNEANTSSCLSQSDENVAVVVNHIRSGDTHEVEKHFKETVVNDRAGSENTKGQQGERNWQMCDKTHDVLMINDKGFPPDVASDKIALIDEIHTKVNELNTNVSKDEGKNGSANNHDALDSDDDTEPLSDGKYGQVKKMDVDKKEHLVATDNVEINRDDEESGGGTSYETAGSSTASQSGKPAAAVDKVANDVGPCRTASNSSGDGTSVFRECRRRKRTNMRRRLSSSSSSSPPTSPRRKSPASSSTCSSTAASSSLDSDDDSNSISNNSSNTNSSATASKDAAETLSWREKSSVSSSEKVKGSTECSRNVEKNSEGSKDSNLEDTKDDELASTSTAAASATKTKKKSKKRQKLEKKRKKRSVSISSKSSETFVSLEDIPGSCSELQDPGFRSAAAANGGLDSRSKSEGKDIEKVKHASRNGDRGDMIDSVDNAVSRDSDQQGQNGDEPQRRRQRTNSSRYHTIMA